MRASLVFQILGILKTIEAFEEYNPTFKNSILKFQYDDNSNIGPKKWKNEDVIKDEMFTMNRCGYNWVSPINIQTENAVSVDYDVVDDGFEHYFPSLEMTIPVPEIQNLEWQFGYPHHDYHGVEITPSHLFVFELQDKLDTHEDFKQKIYSLSFVTLFYCNPEKVYGKRSMHQIDGKRFPLELEFVFFNSFPDMVIDQTLQNGTIAVVLVVLAEISEKANPNLDGLLEAARRFNGPDFDTPEGSRDYTVKTKPPWSPTWLIPEVSNYYFYDDGSFPVPPCWPVRRVYVTKDPITISREQLAVLASIRSKREPSGKLECTYSMLQAPLTKGDIRYNANYWNFQGVDLRHRTAEQIQVNKLRREMGSEI